MKSETPARARIEPGKVNAQNMRSKSYVIKSTKRTLKGVRLLTILIQEQPVNRDLEYYRNRNAQTIDFFHTDSIPFGSAIGWTDIPDKSNDPFSIIS